MHKKIAIIGIGNTLRRDDGIGIIILESLLKLYKKKALDYLNFGTATFDLMHRMQNYDAVLLIDGIKAGLPAGELKIFELKNIKCDFKDSATSTHELDLKSILKLSKKLGLKTKIYVAGIQVKDTSYAEGLSAALEKRRGDIVKRISEFIDKTFNKPSR